MAFEEKSPQNRIRPHEPAPNPHLRERFFCTKITEHRFFEPNVLMVIVFNALWIGYEVNFVPTDPGVEVPAYFMYVEYFFCAFFVTEIVLRFFAYKSYSMFFKDVDKRMWNIFDLFLAWLLIFEVLVLPNVSGGDNMNLPGLSTLRLLRLLRIVRILRMMPELAMMVKSMIAALRSVSMTFVLAVGIMYIFSIVLTQWARDHNQIHLDCQGANCVKMSFGSISKSFLTLMQILCLDNTFSLIRAILDETMFYGFLLLGFILLAAFTVLNMLVGVIVQIVSQTNESERDKIAREKVRHVFHQLDSDGDGTVSQREFQGKNAAGRLEQIGINPKHADIAFSIIDADHNDVIVLDEFLETMFKLMHPPESQDVLLIHGKLDKLEKVVAEKFAAQQLNQRRRPPLSPADASTATPSASHRAAIVKGLEELEFQVTSMESHQPRSSSPCVAKESPYGAAAVALATVPQRPAPGAAAHLAPAGISARSGSPPGRPGTAMAQPGQGLELLRLDMSMRELRQQLEVVASDGLTNNQGSTSCYSPNSRNAPSRNPQQLQPPQQMPPDIAADTRHWRQQCSEVAETLTQAIGLISHVLPPQPQPQPPQAHAGSQRWLTSSLPALMAGKGQGHSSW